VTSINALTVRIADLNQRIANVKGTGTSRTTCSTSAIRRSPTSRRSPR
jgi:hypothetical protein